MKKRALRKDFYMEIRRSLGRFLSIFFIVAIGCAFFSGIRASEPDMRYSGDAYFDNKNMMDLRIISTMGLTEDDVKAASKAEGIGHVEGRYSVDALLADGDNQIVVHVMSMLPTMNEIQLEDGRLPNKENECVVDVDYMEKSKLKIGDTITFSSGTDAEVTDSLKTDTFRITGTVSSPEYIAFQRGSTTIGNGSVRAFVYVQEESFAMDVYTEICIQAAGAKELTAFTSEYEDTVAKAKENIEKIKEQRQKARYTEIVDEANGKIAEAEAEVTDAQTKLENGKAEAAAKLADARQKLENAQAQIDSGKVQLENSKAEVAATEQTLAQKQTEVQNGTAALDQGIVQLNQQIEQLNAVKAQYEALKESGMTDEETLAALEQMSMQIQIGDAAVVEAQAQIDQTRAQLQYAQGQIDNGYAQLEAARQQIAGAEAGIISGEQEIASGWEEYYAGEAEANAEIAEGEQKIAEAQAELADAKAEVAELEKPKWYIYDRNDLPDYSGYGDNADRMKAIGEVFPVIFFLVAALISLTTMTRMVEEQRTQIGTLKALGYARHSIAGKYLGYAFLATLLGSAAGIFTGEKIFPYIIINAYGIMYKHMNELLIPYNVMYGIGAAGTALFCTLAATILACYKELREQAAQLMRPPTPKQGQRVVFEKITFLWKRLNFSWKASVRNLVRYKKRFFMTIFGIGGCMGLMIVGFGLKDSIFAVVDIQYGEIQRYDGTVIMAEGASEKEKGEVAQMLGKETEVDDAMEGILTQITIGNGSKWHDVYLDVPKDKKQFPEFVTLKERTTDRRYSLDEKEVVLTEKIAKELEVQAGDMITIRDEEKGDLKVKIKAVCENYMGHYLYMTADAYEAVYNEKSEYNAVFYKTVSGTTKEAQSVGEDILQLPGALSVSYTTDLKQQVDDMLGALDIVIVVLTISAGMLAFVVLYNLNNINITERKRELATLKVLGFYPNEVSAYVYRENIVLTVLGALFGVALGKILHRFIIVTVEIDTVMFGRNIDMSSFVYSFLLTVAFSMIVNGAMYFKLKKINMVESLKSVE